MIIDHQISSLVVYGDDSIVHALSKISRNRAGLIYVVSPHGGLEAVLSDGDFRRWVVEQVDIDLERPVLGIANRDFVKASVGDSPDEITRVFSAKIKSIPLVDTQGRLVAVAWPGTRTFALGERTLDETDPVLVIAEIGNNHNGSLDVARQLIDAAAASGADVAKFQMRDMDTLYVNAGDPSDAGADLGTQYTLDLLSRFQLSNEELFEAFDHAAGRGLIPLCTPWDLTSLGVLEGYGMVGYKVASADLTNHELIDAIADTGKPMILSTGMAIEKEIIETVERLARRGASFALLHCNSAYPAPVQDINLDYLHRLTELGSFPVGYSGHERGTAVSVAAVAKGARIIERHLTLDRSWEGNDHKVSLLPGEFRSMVRDVREIEQALGSRSARTLSQGEMLNREILAKSLVAAVGIEEGQTITDEMVEARSPGRGLQPNRRPELIGRRAVRPMAYGDYFSDQDLGDKLVGARDFSFSRPWGIPVRYHDWENLAERTNLDLIEIHLSYRDLELDGPSFFPRRLPTELVVHAPELFEGDHLLDLASPDEEYRKRSIVELQRVIDLTCALRPCFANENDPLIVVNVGGFSLDAPLSRAEIEQRYEILAKSFQELDAAGVELIPQTMPPFPWHMGGQRHHNLLVDADDIERFCIRNGMRICMDVSHSQLACAHLGHSLSDFVRRLASHTAHLHLADAEGVDGEGLQVGEGSIVFSALAEDLATHPEISFIPEIWQGHKDDGEGFWVALDRLEEWF
ncbi:MAG: TIM barrel protein [Actinomycetia bacterium]|nr:TIM barrel protein [Actinomycetes bacterium]